MLLDHGCFLKVEAAAPKQKAPTLAHRWPQSGTSVMYGLESGAIENLSDSVWPARSEQEGSLAGSLGNGNELDALDHEILGKGV